MDDVDGMLQWAEDLKEEMQKLPFHEDDIRRSFFDLLYDIGFTYYRGYMLFDIMHFASHNKIIFDESIFAYKKHIHRGMEISKIPELYQSYYNSLNRNFLVSTWSNFEVCTTTLCGAIATTEEKNNLLEFQFNDVIKKLKTSEIKSEEAAELKKLLVKEHLTHAPITRKTDLLFKKAINYKRNTIEDKKFLAFFGKFRNTIHTNFIYYGNNYEYIYEDKAHFVFKNEETVKWNDKYVGGPGLYFDLKTTLKDIWKELAMTIDHESLIPYPVED